MKKLYNLFFKRARKKTKIWHVFLVIPVLILIFFFPEDKKGFSKKALVDSGSFTGYVIAERHAQFSQDYKTASFYAEKIIRSSKKTDDKSLKKLFSYFILSGDFKKTRLFLSENPTKFEKNRLGQFLILTDTVKKNDYKTANKIIKNIEKRNNDRLALPLIKTWILAGLNKKGEAEKSLNFLDTSDTRILYLMHSFYLNDYFGENKKALKILESFDEEQKLNVRFIDYATLFLEKNKDKKTAISFIKKHLETEKSYTNKLYLERFISEDSNHKKFNTRDGLTETFIDLSLILVNPKTANLALFLARLGCELTPESQSAEFAKIVAGELLEKQKDYENALDMFGSINKKSFFYPSSLLKQARIYKKNNNDNLAIKTYQELVEKHPNYLLAVLLLGETYVQNRDYPSARKLYEKLLENTKDHSVLSWEVFYYLGLIYDWEDKKELAEKKLKIAHEKSPKNPIILNYLGYFWIENNKNIEPAMDMIKTALTSAPQNVEFWDSYGWALFKVGKLEQAREILEIAITRKASNPEIRDHLGDVYKALGENKKAIYNWKKAIYYQDIGLGVKDIEKIKNKIRN